MGPKGVNAVSVCGSINMDILLHTRPPQAGETVIAESARLLPGGKGMNQAVAAARTGAAVRLAGAVGGDDFGTGLRRKLAVEGIDDRFVRTCDGSSGIAVVQIHDGDNRIVVASGANAQVDEAFVSGLPQDFFAAAVLLVQLEIPPAAVRLAMQRARAAGAAVLLDPAPAGEAVRALLPLADIITPNRDEAQTLSGMCVDDVATADAAAAALQELGPRVVIVNLGVDGVVVRAGGSSFHQCGFRVPVQDTTGAGDCFSGALGARIAAGVDLREAVRYATAAAAIKVTGLGAQAMPRAVDVEAFLAEEA